MSKSTIKRHNHRIHPCENKRKQELLKHLTDLYQDKNVLIISNANTSTTEIEDKKLTLSNDKDLAEMKDRSWDVLISFDLPKVAQDYITRFKRASEMALILISQDEQTDLYPIEKLLGKNIPQEEVKGFELKKAPKEQRKTKPTKSQLLNADADKKRKENEIDKEKILNSKKEFAAKKNWDKKSTTSGKRTKRVIRVPSKKKDS